jgi:L-cysteine/cystine lyase
MAGIDASTQDLAQHRSYFAALQNKAYFNYGGQGALPKQALAAIFCSYDYVQTNGPFSTKMFTWLEDEINKTKDAVANILNSERRSIALTQNVTEGCNIVMWGLKWQQGDHMLLTDCEHSSVVAIAEQVAARKKIEVTFAQLTDAKADPVQVLADAIQPTTKLVAISHVLWNTGRVLPIADIAAVCKERGVPLLVDGAQSAGMMPLDVQALGVDFYAVTGHKWLCGPEGVGALYVSTEMLEQLRATFVGWRSVEMGPKDYVDATKFEVATSAFPLYAGLRAAMELHNDWAQPAARYEQIKKNVSYLRSKLSEIPSVRFVGNYTDSGLVSFSVEDKTPSELARHLESAGIFVRTIPYPRCVRASVHYFTDKREMDRLVAAVAN